jgi:2-aminoadipate transaminase
MSIDISSLMSPMAKLAPPPKFAGAIGSDVVWNFDQGHPPWDSFPIDDLVRLADAVIQDRGPVVLDYFDQRNGYGEVYYGSVPLRERISEHLRDRWHQDVSTEGIIVTNGSVQAIALAVNGFVGPNDAVFVENATFPYLIRFTEMCGGTIYPIPVDDDGMLIDALEQSIDQAGREGRTPKMIYTIATFQMPTGKVLSVDRRRRLLELAARRGIVVLEDNIYACFRYDGEDVPTLLSMDEAGVVMQSDSFAKTTAPGVRLGWMAGHPDLIAVLSGVRQDFGPNQWLEAVMERYLAEGLLSKHIDRMVGIYREKRDAVTEALDEHCRPLVDFDVPSGSFYYWLRLAEEVNADRLAERTRERGLLARPGEMFLGGLPDQQFMRLAFAHVSFQKIRLGIAELGEALRESTTTSPAASGR